MTITKSAWTAVMAVLATLAVVVVFLFVPTNSAGAAGYTEWTNDGPVVTTHENVAPGTDTDTVRWLPVGEPTKHVTVEAVAAGPWVASGEPVTTEENVAPGDAGENCRWVPLGLVDDNSEDVAGQHYSLAGGSWKYDFAPGFPETGDPNGRIRWQANTEQEPHDTNSATWVNSIVHYTGEPGNSNWFAFTAPVEGKDYGWQKECQTPAVAEVSHLDYKWQKQVRTVITDNPTTPTETVTITPTVPTETVTETPEVPTETETPVSVPQPDKDEPVRNTPPKDVQVIACVNGVWTITVNGEVISESGTCGETPENTVPQTFSETGL